MGALATHGVTLCTNHQLRLMKDTGVSISCISLASKISQITLRVTPHSLSSNNTALLHHYTTQIRLEEQIRGKLTAQKEYKSRLNQCHLKKKKTKQTHHIILWHSKDILPTALRTIPCGVHSLCLQTMVFYQFWILLPQISYLLILERLIAYCLYVAFSHS